MPAIIPFLASIYLLAIYLLMLLAQRANKATIKPYNDAR